MTNKIPTQKEIFEELMSKNKARIKKLGLKKELEVLENLPKEYDNYAFKTGYVANLLWVVTQAINDYINFTVYDNFRGADKKTVQKAKKFEKELREVCDFFSFVFKREIGLARGAVLERKSNLEKRYKLFKECKGILSLDDFISKQDKVKDLNELIENSRAYFHITQFKHQGIEKDIANKEERKVIGIIKVTKGIDYMHLKKGYLGKLIKHGNKNELGVELWYGNHSGEVPLEQLKGHIAIKKFDGKYEKSREYKDDLLRLYMMKYLKLGAYHTMQDIERWLKFLDKERGKPFEKDRAEYLKKAKLEAKLSFKEIRFREEILLAWNMHGNIYTDEWNDPKTCKYPELIPNIRKGLALMKHITEKASLKEIKKLLTHKEYEWFLPAYNEFKKKGKFTISNPNLRD